LHRKNKILPKKEGFARLRRNQKPSARGPYSSATLEFLHSNITYFASKIVNVAPQKRNIGGVRELTFRKCRFDRDLVEF